MAYSLIEQNSRDLDIFFSDGEKLIHMASGGGRLPENLAETDLYNENILSNISQFNPNYEIDINPNLSQILNLDETGLNRYLVSFIEMAKRGLYTYDKTNLGEFEDSIFHLVAKPKSPPKPQILFESYKIFNQVKISNNVIPNKFEKFDLNQFID